MEWGEMWVSQGQSGEVHTAERECRFWAERRDGSVAGGSVCVWCSGGLSTRTLYRCVCVCACGFFFFFFLSYWFRTDGLGNGEKRDIWLGRGSLVGNLKNLFLLWQNIHSITFTVLILFKVLFPSHKCIYSVVCNHNRSLFLELSHHPA